MTPYKRYLTKKVTSE